MKKSKPTRLSNQIVLFVFKHNILNSSTYFVLFIKGSSENNLDSTGADLDDQAEQNKTSSIHNLNEESVYDKKTTHQNQPQRANTTMHVCWHRNTSVSYLDNHRSLVNQLSGYLLRKFKNSNGWQKLWVVFSNFCLFFYKTYQVN
jgi:hypothetical protein